MAAPNNEEELLAHFDRQKYITLNHLEHDANGNANQIEQASHDARHLYALLLKNPNISSLQLATDETYQKLAELINKTDPLAPAASAKGVWTGTVNSAETFIRGGINTLADPLGTFNGILKSIEQVKENPALAFQNFAIGTMEERERLANIMINDNSEQRMQLLNAYYTEFLASRTISLAGTLAAGNFISKTGRAGMQQLKEAAIAAGDGGLTPAMVAGYSSAALDAVATNKLGLSRDALWAAGSMFMNSTGAGDTPPEPGHAPSEPRKGSSAKELTAAAQLATEEYVLTGRLLNQLELLAKTENITAQTAYIAATLKSVIKELHDQARVEMILKSEISQQFGAIFDVLKEKNSLIRNNSFQTSAAAEASVIKKALGEIDSMTSLSAEFKSMVDQGLVNTQIGRINASINPGAALHELAEGALQLQIPRVRGNDLAPGTAALPLLLEGSIPDHSAIQIPDALSQ